MAVCRSEQLKKCQADFSVILNDAEFWKLRPKPLTKRRKLLSERLDCAVRTTLGRRDAFTGEKMPVERVLGDHLAFLCRP